jgi:putative lysine transport system substrate-binding protein
MKRILVTVLVALIMVGCSKPATTVDKLVVGMECDYAPFNWTQVDQTATAVLIDGGSAGYCDGYDVAMAQKIATGLNQELVIKKIAWDGLPIAVNNDEIDLIIAGMTDTPERRNGLDFTTPYFTSQMVLIVRKDSSYVGATSIQDFNGAKVVAQHNTFHDVIIDQIQNVNHVTPMKTFPLMTLAVVNGDVDAMVSELPVAMAIINNNPDLIYIEFTGTNGFEVGADATVSIALKKGNTDLLTKVQAVLDQLTAEQRQQMMADAIARNPEQ